MRAPCCAPCLASFAPLRTRTRLGKAYARLFPAVPPALVLPYLGPLVWLAPGIMERRYGLGERDLLMRILSNAIISWGSSRALMQFCDMLESGRLQSADDFDDDVDGRAGGAGAAWASADRVSCACSTWAANNRAPGARAERKPS